MILDYIRKKSHRKDIEYIICQIDTSTDVRDLHTLFSTEDISKVVEAYGKSFSAVFWNYIDKKDESCFQVPSLMMMDSNCMNITNVVKTIPYHQRRNGVNKINGIATRKSNTDEIIKLLNSDLNIDNAVTLLKLKRDLKEPSIIKAIEIKLSDFEMLESAKKIMEKDRLANQNYIYFSDNEKKKTKQEILSNIKLQKDLQKKRLDMKLDNDDIDIYMATYVEMLEEVNRNRFFKSAKNQKSEDVLKVSKREISSDDMGKIPEIRNIKSTPIKEWFRDSFYKFKSIIGKDK